MALGLSVAIAAVGTLSACGDSTPTGTTLPSATVDVPIQPTIPPIDTALPTFGSTGAATGGHFDEASNLSEVTCSATNGVWSFTGTLTNPEEQAHDFTVAVVIVKAPESTEATTVEKVVPVAGGQSVEVTVPSVFTEPAGSQTGDYQCLHGVTIKEQ